jgi:hypothetical protein
MVLEIFYNTIILYYTYKDLKDIYYNINKLKQILSKSKNIYSENSLFILQLKHK